ncbi:SEC14-like protein 6, partial [Nephila pilipes]
LWNSARPSEGLKTAVLFIEKDIMHLHQQNEKLGKSFTKVGYVYNLENVTYANATSMKTVELIMDHCRTYLDNYPERMKYAYLINVPVFFSIFFSFVKTILSSSLLEKLRFYGSDTIVFDNSNSWMHSKEVFYRIRVRGPNEDENKLWS